MPSLYTSRYTRFWSLFDLVSFFWNLSFSFQNFTSKNMRGYGTCRHMGASRYCYLENVAAFCSKVWKPWPTRWATHSRNSTSHISMVSIFPCSFSSLLSLTSAFLFLVASAVDCETYVRLNLAEGFQVIFRKFSRMIFSYRHALLAVHDARV